MTTRACPCNGDPHPCDCKVRIVVQGNDKLAFDCPNQTAPQHRHRAVFTYLAQPVTVACPCRSDPERCTRKVRTTRPLTHTSLAANCPNIDEPGHRWRSVIGDVTDSGKRISALRDARRTQHAADGGARRHAPGAEAGHHLGAQDIDDGLKTRVHAASLEAVDINFISDRAITILGELGGRQRICESFLGFTGQSDYMQQRQTTSLQIVHLCLSQKLTATLDVEMLGSRLDRSLPRGEQEVAMVWDSFFGVAQLKSGARLTFIGETSDTWYEDKADGSGKHRVGEVLSRASQVEYATRVRQMGVKDVLHHFGAEPVILEIIARGAFTTHNIGDLFAVLFRLTSNNQMTDFDCPVNMDALARLILDRRFRHRAQPDVTDEFNCLLELLPALCCLLVLDSRFGQRLMTVCGPLPQLPADVVGPHRRLLEALRAIVTGRGRVEHLALVKGVVDRVEAATRRCATAAAARPRVQPESAAPSDAASQPRPKPRQKTPRLRTEAPKTAEELRRSGHLKDKPPQQLRVLDVNWASGAQSLLDTIKKEPRERRDRFPNLETFRPTLLRYGFSVPPELLDGHGRHIQVPECWPTSNGMRTVAELVRYLEGALANPEDSKGTNLLAPAPAPRVLDDNWPRTAQLLLDRIREEDRPSMEKLRPMLEECGFVGPSPPWGSRVIDAPERWPKGKSMRRVTELVRYLEGALKKVSDTEETGASTAPAPPSRAQPPPPPRRALSPPRAPLARPSTVLGVGTIVKIPFRAYGFDAVGCVLETPSEVAESGLVCVDVNGEKLKIMKSDLGPIQRLAADTSPDTVAPMKKKKGGDGKPSTTKEKKISPFKQRPTGQSVTTPAPAALSKLVAVGIERGAAEAALEAHDGNLSAAANALSESLLELATAAVPSDGAVSLLDTGAASDKSTSIDEDWDDSDEEAPPLLDTNAASESSIDEDWDDSDEEAS